MKRIIDIHSHILPGVDDGCQSIYEAVRMLRMYEEQDVEAVICTPHYGPCAVTGANVKGAFEQLTATKSNVNLYLGNEIYVRQSTLTDVRSGKAKRLAGSDFVLIEFNEWGKFSTSAERIVEQSRKLAESEFVPVLAHAERYASLRAEPELYKVLAYGGVLLQVNAYDIYDNKNAETVTISRRLLRDGLVSFIGSDAHGAERRSPKLKNGVKWIYDNCPTEYADAIVHDNAEAMIKGGA